MIFDTSCFLNNHAVKTYARPLKTWNFLSFCFVSHLVLVHSGMWWFIWFFIRTFHYAFSSGLVTYNWLTDESFHSEVIFIITWTTARDFDILPSYNHNDSLSNFTIMGLMLIFQPRWNAPKWKSNLSFYFYFFHSLIWIISLRHDNTCNTNLDTT